MKNGWSYYRDIDGSEVKHAPKTLIDNVYVQEAETVGLQSLLDAKLQNEASVIQTTHIADGAVLEAKLANAAVTSGKIANGAIKDEHIPNEEISPAKITDFGGTVITTVQDKLAQVTSGIVSENELYRQVVLAIITSLQKIGIEGTVGEDLYIKIASIAQEQIDHLKAQTAEILEATIQTANIDWANISQLTTAIAQVTLGQIKTADIDFAKIKDMVADKAIITQGTGGDLYISRLRVTDANMVSLTTGKLVVKGEDGKYYQITVGEDGNVTPVEVKVEGANIEDSTVAGSNLIENAISARELNAQAIFADEATMINLFAGMGRFGELFAASAVMPHITANVIASDALSVKVSDAIAPYGVTRAATAPANPTKDMLWLDTGVTPNLLKRWDGSAWTVVNDVGARNLIPRTSSEYVEVNTGEYYKNLYELPARFPLSDLGLKVGDKIVFSADIDGGEYGARVRITTYSAATGTDDKTMFYGSDVLAAVLKNSTLKVVLPLTATHMEVSIQTITPTQTSNNVRYKCAKLETGTTATDWTPAPEDIQQVVSQASADISVLKDRISSTVTEETYTTGMAEKADNAKVNELVQSVLSQTTKQISMKFDTVNSHTIEMDGKLQDAINELRTYINFSSDGIELGEHKSPFKTLITNTEISFLQSGQKVAYINNNKLYIRQLEVTQTFKTGGFQKDIAANGEIFMDWTGVK